VRIVASALVGIVIASGVADAQPAGYLAPVPVQYRDEEWYGWKIAISDAAAFATMYLASEAYDRSLGPEPDEDDVGNVGYLLIDLGAGLWWIFGTPVVHLLERNPVGAGKSVVARLGMPVAGVLIGSLFDEEASADDPYATAGLLAGVAAASTVDILFFANRRELKTRWVQPQLGVTGSSVHIGLAGAF
jgi:hypothetical protein